MKKNLVTFLLVLLLAGAFGGRAGAAVVAITDDPLTIGGGARPLGMGRAFTAVADDADAVYINPAGLANIRGPQVMTMYTQLLEDVYYTEFAGAIPSMVGTLGFGYISTGVNQIPVTTGSSVLYADYYDSLFLLSYSSTLRRFSEYGSNIFVGGNLKLFNRGWTGAINSFGSGYGADFGIKAILSPALSVGISRQNILPVSMGGVIHWGPGTDEALAGITKLGIAVRPLPWQGKALIAYDIDIPAQSARPLLMHLGFEWKIEKMLILRTGLDQSADPASPGQISTSPTYGISIGASGFRLDYAYHTYYNDPSLAANYVSVSYSSDPWFALQGWTE